jgi:ABC-2 type transport system ATP-binding protein
MLIIENLTKKFSAVTAVDNLSLSIPPGEIFGFIGPNGAGKTTTLKICTGLMKPTAGRVVVNGFDMQTAGREAKRIIGYVSDQPYVYPLLTGREFLRFIGDLYAVGRDVQKNKIPEFLDMFELTPAAGELIESYSHGMKQKLVIAGVLLHAPKLLVLDEPLVGLDPKTARLMKHVLQEYASRGVSIFMSTHILEIAEKICHRVGIIHRGRLICEGTIGQLREQAKNQNSLEDMFLDITGGTEYQELLKYL